MATGVLEGAYGPQRYSKKSPGSATWSTMQASCHTLGHIRSTSSAANAAE